MVYGHGRGHVDMIILTIYMYKYLPVEENQQRYEHGQRHRHEY
jgi:hypothetical protein